MANDCEFSMKIKGKKNNCNEWLKKLESYSEENHFWRIFDSEVIFEEGTDDKYEMEIVGYCAWSLLSCCIDGYTDVDLFAINTGNLNLVMEAYSAEEGIGFQEHYIYNRGVCECSECEDCTWYFWDKEEYPEFNLFKKENNVPDEITEELFDNEGWCRIGGLDSQAFQI